MSNFRRVIATAAIIFCTFFLMAPAARAGELVSLGSQGDALRLNDPLNTGAFNCSGDGPDSGKVTKTYTMPQTIQLKGVVFFPGAWNRVVADIGWRLINITTNKVIYWTNWDHYPAPQLDAQTGGPGGPLIPQQVQMWFPSGDYMTLSQGDVIELQVYCKNYVHFGFAVQAHVAATLYGVVVP